MSESSVIEELVDQIKKSRKKGGSRSSRSSRPKMKHSVTSSEAPISKSKSKSSKKGLFGGLLGDLGKNKMFLIGLAVLLVLAIGYYMMKKKKKTQNSQNNQDEQKKQNKQQLDESHMEKVKEILQKRDQYEKENNIVKLKLPEKYLTDENGRPVILTPEVIQRIKSQPVHVNNQQNSQQNTQQTSRRTNQKRPRPSKKQVKQQQIEESEDYSDDEDDEDDNVQSQNLTKQEMEELKNQLEMMDSNIIPSNS